MMVTMHQALRSASLLALAGFTLAACSEAVTPPEFDRAGPVTAFSKKGPSLHVPGDFASISDAVAAAAPGQLILVQGGEWAEIVTVTTAGVTLRGVAGAHLRGTFDIQANDVSIEGFTVTTDFYNQGLQAFQRTGLSVKNNTFYGRDDWDGDFRAIWLPECQGCSIKNNTVSGHEYEGIVVLGDATGTVLKNNRAFDNGVLGIILTSDSFGAAVENNEARGHPYCDIVNNGTDNTAKNNRADCVIGF